MELRDRFAKKHKVDLGVYGNEHIVTQNDIHLDVVGYVDCDDFDKFKKDFTSMCEKAGYSTHTCVQMKDWKHTVEWCQYIFKIKHFMRKGKGKIYLPCTDGRKRIKFSTSFYETGEEEAIWDKYVEEIRSKNSLLTSSHFTPTFMNRLHRLINSKMEIKDKIIELLPWRKKDALTADQIMWLLGLDVFQTRGIFMNIDDLCWDEDRMYLPKEKKGGYWMWWTFNLIPFHQNYFPDPVDYNILCNEIVKEWEEPKKETILEVPTTEEDFIKELQNLTTEKQ